ncbi:AGAP013405-PA-like protein [Anopheles sinensis]|uniref:AGAP013405-PA-like protein n=1 Tax=Anopheles sinensis TaxID=74873 RepID=A0A084W1Q2_ANOSI|nr:AGAP013405-PA-like protein [Anopheles sinensis]
MSKSPGSVVSSDETHSASEESLVISAANSQTSLKSIGVVKPPPRKVSKDDPSTATAAAKERPPWRPASIAVVPTPPKPDIKARLLEASKRMRRVNAVVQTDPVHTKLMKEASTDEQTDLIPMVDEEILTDGNLVVREVGNLILTHSVAQMTEGVSTCDSGTQTAIPRSGISFRKFLEPLTDAHDQPSTPISGQPVKLFVEEPLQDLGWADIEEQLKPKLNIPNADDSEGSHAQEPDEPPSSQSGSDSMKEPNTPDLISATVEGDPSPHRTSNFLETPTFAAWQNLDFSDEDSESYVPRELPRRSVGEGDRPWAEFKDLVIGSRVANMRLSPVPPRRPRRPNQKTVTWSDRQHRAYVW